MRCFLLLSLASLCSFAQTGSVGFPALGFAPDSRSGQIRPIRGIPGAALLGDPLDAVSAYTTAAISPAQDLALAVSSADNQVYLVPLSGEPARLVANAMPAPSHMVFSPSGQAAVIWGERMQVLTELASTPRAADIELAPFGPLAAVAVSDDTQALLVSSAREDTPVWLSGTGGRVWQLPLPGTVAAMAFRRGSHDAVAVTRSGDVYLVLDAGPGAEIRLVYAGDQQTSDPVAVQVSPDGTRAFTANSRGMVAAIDFRTASAAAVSCHCSPAGLEPLASASVYRLTGISNLPVMLFDASSSTPRIWFVPSDASSASRERSAQ